MSYSFVHAPSGAASSRGQELEERDVVERPGPVCRHCGVYVPALCKQCDCGAELPSSGVEPPPHRTLWLAVKASFRCRSCDFFSPLDKLEQNERVHCAQCGALQRLGVDGWRAALGALHAQADLRWPRPEGRMPSHAIYIGEDNDWGRGAHATAFSQLPVHEGAGAALHLEVAPGHPTCHACRRAVLQVQLDVRGGEVQTRCPSCDDRARYPMVSVDDQQLPVIAPEARMDRPRLRLDTMVAGGPIALLCPRCGAPFAQVNEEENVRCKHCSCIAYVPVRARAPRRSARGMVRVAAPFFVGFEGPSAERLMLERQVYITHGSALKSALSNEVQYATSICAPIEPPQIERHKSQLKQWSVSVLTAGLALLVGFAFAELVGLIDLM